MYKRIPIRLTFLAAALAGLVSCNEKPTYVGKKTFAVSTESLTLTEGRTAAVGCHTYPQETPSWTFSPDSVARAEFDGDTLLTVTALAVGQADLTLSCHDIRRRVSVTVRPFSVPVTGITLTPASGSVSAGDTLRLKAAVEPADATDTRVHWHSTAAGVARVDSTGLVTAVRAGTATIVAVTRDGGRTARSTVTVCNRVYPVTGITVEPAAATLETGRTVQLAATVMPGNASDRRIVWSSDNNAVATVDTAGLARGVRAGTAVITATSNDGGRTAYCRLTVTDPYIPVTRITVEPAELTMEKGSKEQLALTVSPSGATDRSVVWTSGNKDVATVNADGVIEAIGPGRTTVTATSNDNASAKATCNVSVEVSVRSVLLSEHTLGLVQEQTATLTPQLTPSDATGRDLVWTSSDESVATVSGGTVTAILGGEATITATAPGGARDTCRVTVTNLPDRLEGADWSDGLSSTAMTPTEAARTGNLTVTVRYRQNGIVSTYTGNSQSYASCDLVSFDWKTSGIVPEGAFTLAKDCAGAVISARHNGSGTVTCTVGDRSGSGGQVTLARAVTVSYRDRFAASVTVTPADRTRYAFKGRVIDIPFRCSVLFTDNSTEDRTQEAVWSCRSQVGAATIDAGVMRVSAIGDYGSYRNAVGGDFTAVASYGGVTAEATAGVHPALQTVTFQILPSEIRYRADRAYSFKVSVTTYGGRYCNGNTCSFGDNSQFDYEITATLQSGQQAEWVEIEEGAEGYIQFLISESYRVKCRVTDRNTGESMTVENSYTVE